MAVSLLDALAARRGIVCAVGAGGKKTTLYRLAQAARAAGVGRIGLTTTVQSGAVPESVGAHVVVAEPEEIAAAVVEAAAAHPRVAFARPAPKPGRVLGLPPELVAAIHGRAGFGLTLVKADGARMRLIKAPHEDEPLLPPGAATVLPIVSARAIGRPLDDAAAHRIDRLEAVTGARRGEPIAAEHVARLLASPEGSLRGVGAAVVVPVITAVEDGRERGAAREVAERALALTDRFARVVLADMRAEPPVVEVVGRGGR